MPAYGLRLYTAPTEEPVSLADAKKQVELAEGYTSHDAHLRRLIVAARNYAETITGRAICTQTWELDMDCWPSGGVFMLPKPPLVSITHVKYYDADGTQQTWSSANYVVSTGREPGLIRLAYSKSLPTARYQPDSITVRYVAGYGGQSAVPDGLRAAMLLMIAHWFEHRTEGVTGTITSTIDSGAKALLEQYRVGDEFAAYGGAVYAE